MRSLIDIVESDAGRLDFTRALQEIAQIIDPRAFADSGDVLGRSDALATRRQEAEDKASRIVTLILAQVHQDTSTESPKPKLRRWNTRTQEYMD